MQPRPARHQRTPAYPTRREVLAGAASFVLVGLSGGGFRFAEAAGPRLGGTLVAPVFEHGDGRGSTGCIVVGPPTFLSEEEGMQILREELAKHRIQLKPGGILEGVNIPARVEQREIIEQGVGPAGTTVVMVSIVEVPDSAKPLQLDGIDADKKIAVEYVSREGYTDIGGVRGGTAHEDYDFKDAAEWVASTAMAHGTDRVFLGVFYDPVTFKPPAELEEKAKAGDPGPLREWEQGHRRKKDGCKNLLRQQAQDFVAWLKQQKAIP